MMEECARKAKKGAAGKKEAWKVLGEMEGLGIQPNTETFTSLIKVLAKAARHGNANAKHGNEAIAEMRARGLQPTAVTSSALLSLYAQTAKRGGKVTLDDAWSVVKEVGSGGDEFVYAGLMDVCAKLSVEGRASMADATKILSYMDASGVTGDTYVWNSMVQVCINCINGQPGGASFQDAIGVLDSMASHKIKPDTFTFSLLFMAGARAVQSGEAKSDEIIGLLKKRMAASKVKPNLVIFNTILSVYVRGAEVGDAGAETVKKLLAQVDDAGLSPDRTFFGSCMSLLAAASLHGRANGADARYARPLTLSFHPGALDPMVHPRTQPPSASPPQICMLWAGNLLNARTPTSCGSLLQGVD